MLLNKFTWIFRMIIFNLFLLYSMGFWCYKTIQSNAIFDVVTFNATRAKAWNVIFILWTSIHPLLRKFFLGKVRPSQFYQRSFILAAQVLSDHCYLWPSDYFGFFDWELYMWFCYLAAHFWTPYLPHINEGNL